MIIASIDAGAQTGLAVAKIVRSPNSLKLRQKLLVTVDNPSSVVEKVCHELVHVVVMERRPAHPSEIGLTTFETVWNDLIRQGFRRSHHNFLDSAMVDTIFLVNPGQWKPVMKRRSPDLGDWEPHTDHERDALHLLYYVVWINNTHHTVLFE